VTGTWEVKVLQMSGKALALIAAVITGTSFGATAQTRVVTSDETAQFVPLEIGKFIVIDLPAEAKDVMVADPKIANVILRTATRATILGMGPGQTNIAFYDAGHHQIEALDITVQKYSVPATVPSGPKTLVTVVEGPGRWKTLSCT
jgi:pilus assembly protein CpaC